MTEFAIIEEFCYGIGPSHPETTLGVGDDAAIISVPSGMQLHVSMDTMVVGVHFYEDASPESIAHKLLAVNLSDMAAMGATPKWATLSLSIPTIDHDWLKAFSNTLKTLCTHYGVQLIGGDTTQGELNLSLNIMGLTDKGKAISRNGAMLDDDVYVSHTVGDAALGLLVLQDKLKLATAFSQPLAQTLAQTLVQALEYPEPRVELGQHLLNLVTAGLDVSDGLTGDLSHICEQSDVSIELDLESIPISKAYQAYLDQGGDMALALNGGDDYEIAFTANTQQRQAIDTLAKKLDIRLTRIGRVITKTSDKVSLFENGKALEPLSTQSFEHFS